jgi:hypothetical protein
MRSKPTSPASDARPPRSAPASCAPRRNSPTPVSAVANLLSLFDIGQSVPQRDELIHVLDGAATLEILGEDGPQSFALRAGMIAVNPQGAWHRFQSSEGVTLMAATPFPSEVIELDVDDPRTVARKPA